jgi:hypothetical protein
MVARTIWIITIFTTSVLLGDEPGTNTESWLGNTVDIQSPGAKRAIRTFARTMQDLESDFKKKSDAARSDLIASLEKDLNAATKNNKLDSAIQLRDAISSLRAIQTRSPDTNTKHLNPFRNFVGTWAGNWGSNGGRVSIAIDASGNIADDHGPIKPLNGPYFFSTKYSPKALIPLQEKIVALTWRTRTTPMRNQPHHAAILSRVNEKTKK